jgi:hypothetical protein
MWLIEFFLFRKIAKKTPENDKILVFFSFSKNKFAKLKIHCLGSLSLSLYVCFNKRLNFISNARQKDL